MSIKNLTNEQLNEVAPNLSAIEYKGSILYVAYTIPTDEDINEKGVIAVYIGNDYGADLEEYSYNDIRKNCTKLFKITQINV